MGHGRLGERQHGHIAAVGFEMYARLLEEAVHELRGEPVPSGQRAQLNLGLDLQIPISYIEDPLQRLTISKRLASARRDVHLEQLQSELRDRYGPLPAEVERLFSYAQLRLLAEDQGVAAIDRKGDSVVLRLTDEAPVDLARLVARVAQEDDWSLTPPDRLVVRTDGASAAELVERLRGVIESLA